jgi:hypothetical protein
MGISLSCHAKAATDIMPLTPTDKLMRVKAAFPRYYGKALTMA